MEEIWLYIEMKRSKLAETIEKLWKNSARVFYESFRLRRCGNRFSAE